MCMFVKECAPRASTLHACCKNQTSIAECPTDHADQLWRCVCQDHLRSSDLGSSAHSSNVKHSVGDIHAQNCTHHLQSMWHRLCPSSTHEPGAGLGILAPSNLWEYLKHKREATPDFIYTTTSMFDQIFERTFKLSKRTCSKNRTFNQELYGYF